MAVYVFGAGASVSAGYPLASKLLNALSAWLDRCDDSIHWVPRARNRILQLRETFGPLDDFESILERLDACGQTRITPTGPTTYQQDPLDILHDYTEGLQGIDGRNPELSAQGFYPQYLRSDLVLAFGEFFYETETKRVEPVAYDTFAHNRATSDSSIITFNYDVAVERSLAKCGNWDVGHGYGFPFLPDRPASAVKVYKLHGSVNWFKQPVNHVPPPLVFKRDIQLLGYENVVDPRVGEGGIGVDSSATLILPKPQKSFYWESFWKPLWKAASESLREASEVFIHGYSMPVADARARDMLFGNISKSATIHVHCRSTSDRIATEFLEHGFSRVAPYPTIGFEDWVTSSPECSPGPKKL